MICNIIDGRSNRYRWKKVHATIESTWHDNSVSGADKAPESTSDTDVDFAQLGGITLNEAVNWADRQDGPVTLYIADDAVSDSVSSKELDARLSSREVDAAARILDTFGRSRKWWSASLPPFDDLDPPMKADFRFLVYGMLCAAAKIRDEEAA